MKSLPVALLAAGFLLADSNSNQPIRGFSADESRDEHEREAQARSIPQADRIRAFARRLSSKPHAAGSAQSKANASYIQAQLQEWGLDVHIESFEPLLPYPTARTLEMVAPVRYVAQLREPAMPEDKDSGQAGQLRSEE